MVAIVAGQGLGLLNTSANLLGDKGQLGNPAVAPTGERVYVNASTGNLVIQQQDEWLVGMGPDVGITRTYNSQGNGTDDNGDNWRLGLSRTISTVSGGVAGASGAITRVAEDGAETVYRWDATRQAYVSRDGAGALDTIQYVAGTPNTWVWTDGDSRLVETYEVTSNGQARLKSVSDTDGNKLVLTYVSNVASEFLISKIETFAGTTGSGETVTIDYYQAAGQTTNIQSITTVYKKDGVSASMKRVSYTYETYTRNSSVMYRLKSVTVDLTPNISNDSSDSTQYVTTYGYLDSTVVNRLSYAVGGTLQTVITINYAYGKVLGITETPTNSVGTYINTNINYTGTGITSVTDSSQRVTELYQEIIPDQNYGQLKRIVGPQLSRGEQNQIFEYDVNGNVIKITDGRGLSTTYGYDANGNRTYERDAQNNVVRRTYSTTNQLLTETAYTDLDPDGEGTGAPTAGLTTRYVYDNKEHLRFVVSPAGRVTEHRYAANGLRQSTQQYSVGLYDISTLGLEQVLSLSSMESWASALTDKSSMRVDYTYNSRGQFDKQTAFAKVDAATGAGVSDGTQSVSQFVYDQAGNLLQKIDGRADAVLTQDTQWAIDQRRNLGIRNAAGEGKLVKDLTAQDKEKLKASFSTTYQYDGLNRITVRVDPAADGQTPQTTLTTYSPTTQQTQVTLANGLITTTTYDRQGRVLSVAQGTSGATSSLGTTDYTYNRLGQLASVTQPTGEKSYYLYDEMGRKVGEIDGEGVLTEYVYNANGQLTSTYGYANKVSASMLKEVEQLKADGAKIGLPVNLANKDMYRWSFSRDDALATHITYSTNLGAAGSGTLEGETTMLIQQAANGSASGASLNSLSIGVGAGKKYAVSLLVGAVNANAAFSIEYFNSSGQRVGNLIQIGSLTANTYPGGSSVSNFIKMADVTIAPQGAVRMRMVVQKSTSQNNNQASTLQVANPVISEVPTAYTYNSWYTDLRPKKNYDLDAEEFRIYDNAGRLNKTIKLSGTSAYTTGSVVEYRYDGGGRLTDQLAYAKELSVGQAAWIRSSPNLSATNGTIETQSGSIVFSADDNTRRTRYFYDADGRQVGMLDAQNYLTVNAYDAAGRLVSAKKYAVAMVGTLPDGNVMPAVVAKTPTTSSIGAYVRTSNTDQIIGGADQTTLYSYNSLGQLTTVIDPANYATAYEYDSAGNKIKETRYADLVTTRSGTDKILLGSFSQDGKIYTNYYANTTSTENQITSYEYNGNNRLTRKLEQPIGLETLYTYDSVGNLTQTVQAKGYTEERVLQKKYDLLGRVVAELTAEGAKALAGKTDEAQINAVWNQYATRYIYDIGGHRIATIEPNGVNEAGNKTIYYYDKAGRLTHSINALGEVSESVYDSFGRVITARRSASRLPSTTLNSLSGGLSSAAQAALTLQWDYSKDNATEYSYDKAGRLIATLAPANANNGYWSNYGYNAFGELTYAWLPDTTYHESIGVKYVRDRRGLITRTESISLGAVLRNTQTQYDAFGRAYRSIDAMGNAVERAYDKRGRVILLSNAYRYQPNAAASYFTTTTYDAFDRVLSIADPYQYSTTNYSYNSAARTTTMRVYDSFTGDPQAVSVTQLFDRLGQQVKVTDKLGNYNTYEYNADGQLKASRRYAASGGSPLSEEQTAYDMAGRVYESRDSKGVVTRLNYDGANRVLTRVVDAAVGGLQLTTSYKYDALGRVQWIKDAVGTWTLSEYDPDGRLTARVIDPRSIPSGNGDTLMANPAAGGGLALRTEFLYDPQGHQIAVIEGAGTAQAKRISYHYDDMGRRVKEVIDEGDTGLGAMNVTTEYAYDNNDNLVARIDAEGYITRYTYNAANQLSYTVAADGAVTRDEYNAKGLRVRTTAYARRIGADSLTGLGNAPSDAQIAALMDSNDAANQVTLRMYDSLGRLQSTRDAMGYITGLVYDGAGNVIERTAYKLPLPLSSVDSYEFEGTWDIWWTPVADTSADQADRTERTFYDAANRPIWSIDAAGGVTQNTYDGNSRITQVRRFANLVTKVATQRSTLPAGEVAITGTGLNAGDLTVLSNDSKDQVTHRVYDNAGRLTWTVDAEKYATEYTYDGNDHLKTTTRYSTALTSYTAGSGKPAVSRNSAVDATTTNTYDTAGRRTDAQDAEGTIEHTAYDSVGRVTDVTQAYGDASQQVTTHFEYDQAGRLVAETRAYGTSDAATTKYELDALGQRVQLIDPRGIEAATGTSAWAVAERVRILGGTTTTRAAALAVGSTNYNTVLAKYTTVQMFDELGRVKQTIDALGGMVFTEYDAFGNTVKVTDPKYNVGYFYFDKNNQSTLHIDPEGYAVETTFDAFGQAQTITRLDTKITAALSTTTRPTLSYVSAKDAKTTITHDKLGRQTQIQDAEGFSEYMAYDALGNKTEYTNKLGGKFIYTHDKLGRVLTEKQPVQVKELNADGSIKLTNNVVTLKDVFSRFSYDSRGNLLTKVEGDGLVAQQRTTTYTYDKLNRIKTTAGESMTVYDPATDTESTTTPIETRWYDQRGNLIEVEAADKGRTLSYWDALNRKVAEVNPVGTLTQWDYDDAGLVIAQRIYGEAVTVAAGQRGGNKPSPVSATKVRETRYAYDANGRQKEVTLKDTTYGSKIDAGPYSVTTADVTTYKVYNKTGQVIKETDGRGNSTYNYYDKLGNRILQVDAERYVSRWTYDEAGQVLTETRYAQPLPPAISVSTSSDAAALLLAVPTPSDNRTVEYVYDRMGRVKEKWVKNVEQSTVNTNSGSLSTTTADAVSKFDYNALGGVIKQTDAANQITDMDYDLQGRLIKTQAPSFIDWEGYNVRPTTELEYNALGLQGRAIQRGRNNTVETDDRITSYVYGKNGVRTSETDPEGNLTAYGYDAMYRITKRDITRLNADASRNNDRLRVRYDKAGRQIEQITTSKLSTAPSYTQLKSEQIDYNAWGEIRSKGENGGAQRQYEYDNAGRLWRSNDNPDGAVKVYYYDQNGNATLELTSSTQDLLSNTVLPNNSAASLSTLLSTNSANPKFNVYNKLNKLVDSFEPSMSGSKQNASLTPRTETINTTTHQEPFASGVMNAYSYGVTYSTAPWATDPDGWAVWEGGYASGGMSITLNLPTDTVYGAGSYRIVAVLKLRELDLQEFHFDFTYQKTVSQSFSGGSVNFSESLTGRIHAGNLREYYIDTQIDVFQMTQYGEINLLSLSEHCKRTQTTPIVFTKTETHIEPKLNVFTIGNLGPNAQAVDFRVKKSGTSDAYTSVPTDFLRINGTPIAGTFVVNWSSLASTNYDFIYTVSDSLGGKVAAASGTATITGLLKYKSATLTSLTPESRPDIVTTAYQNYLDWTLGASAAFDLSVHRKQVYNAYGESIRSIRYKRDESNALVEVATEYAYNALGKLIQKKDPTVLVTLENGFRKQVSPTTRYFYDAVGRLVGTQDANGNTNTMTVLAGSTADQATTASEFHADRRLVETTAGSGVFMAREGVKRNRYDVFGQLRRSANENWDGVADVTPYAITYTYNANGHLTSINRPGAADENYEVDSQGNRIATTLAADANGTRHRELTYLDALGRITRTVTAFGRNTSYTYEWVSAIAGGGGWRCTTTTIDGTLIDDTDVFGRTRWHKDLSNHAFTYRYNNAGLLSSQSSLATDGTPAAIAATLTYTGQNLSFNYYGNGLLKDTLDNTRLSWTKYRYDDSGNRVFEGYARNYNTADSPDWEYFQYSEASYDDAGRLVRVWDPKSDINYEYDAVGNRRRVLSKYHDGAQGGLQTQDYWYAYDNMNRFTVTMGSLSSANGNTRATTESDTTIKVVQGSSGRLVSYDQASQRRSAVTAQGTERYSYDAEGYLEEVTLNNNRIAWRDNDARGNVMLLEEKTSEGVVRRTFTYDADNNLKTERNELQVNGTTRLKSSTTNTLTASGLLDISVTQEYKDDGVTVTNTITTDNDYAYWDDAKQSQISIRATNPNVSRYWEPGSTTLSYDVNGHTERATDLAGNRHFYYNTDADGRVIRREEIDGPDKKPSKQNQVAAQRSQLFYQNYYFFNGREVGTVSNDPAAITKDYGLALSQGKQEAYYKRAVVVSANFDQNYQPIGTNYPSRTAANYTVTRTGETLQQIALAVWGDASMWYLIAEANGLTASSTLEAGQRLIIPNKVTNIHNNTQTGRVYDPSQSLGDISPSLPDPPPPPEKGCGAIGMILMVVVAVVATVLTAGALAAPVAGATGGLGGTFSAGLGALGLTGSTAGGIAGLGLAGSAAGTIGLTGFAVAGAVGSVASQLVGLATGVIDKFSWSGVALGAIGSMAGGGLANVNFGLGEGLGSFGNVVARSVTANAISQGIGVVTGLQRKFDWRSVAAAAVGSTVAQGVSGLLPGGGGQVGQVLRGTVSRVAGAAARSLVDGQKPQWAAIGADAFGSALGDAVVGSIVQREQAAFENKHPVVGADEKAQILAGFAGGPGGDYSGGRDFAQDVQNRRALMSMGLDPDDIGTVADGAARMSQRSIDPRRALAQVQARLTTRMASDTAGGVRGSLDDAMRDLADPRFAGALRGGYFLTNDQAAAVQSVQQQYEGVRWGDQTYRRDLSGFARGLSGLDDDIVRLHALTNIAQSRNPGFAIDGDVMLGRMPVLLARDTALLGLPSRVLGGIEAILNGPSGYSGDGSPLFLNPNTHSYQGQEDIAFETAGLGMSPTPGLRGPGIARSGLAFGFGERAASTLMRVEAESLRVGRSGDELLTLVSPESGAIVGQFTQAGNKGRPPESFLKSMNGSIFTHNHPSGTTLGFEDVSTAIAYGAKQVRAVGAESTYALDINVPASARTNMATEIAMSQAALQRQVASTPGFWNLPKVDKVAAFNNALHNYWTDLGAKYPEQFRYAVNPTRK